MGRPWPWTGWPWKKSGFVVCTLWMLYIVFDMAKYNGFREKKSWKYEKCTLAIFSYNGNHIHKPVFQHILETIRPIKFKFGVVLYLTRDNEMMTSELKNSKKGRIRSTLTLGARKSVKVKGQGQGHIRCACERRIQCTLLQVSILIRTEVMTKNVFRTFLVTLTLTLTRSSQ